MRAEPGGGAELVVVRGGVGRPKEGGGAPRGAEALDPSRLAFTSPSVTYAGLPCHAPPFSFNGRRAQARARAPRAAAAKAHCSERGRFRAAGGRGGPKIASF